MISLPSNILPPCHEIFPRLWKSSSSGNLVKLIMSPARLICFGALWRCAMDLQGLNRERLKCCRKIYFLLNFASEEWISDILHLKVNEILPQIVVCGPINSLPHFLRKFLFVPTLRKLGSIWQNGRCNTSHIRETGNLFYFVRFNAGPRWSWWWWFKCTNSDANLFRGNR